MKNQLLVKAINLMFEEVCLKYDEFGEFITVNNVEVNTMLRLTSAIETAMDIEYAFGLGKSIDDLLYTKAKRVHYQCKRELVRSRIVTFEEAFETNKDKKIKIIQIIKGIQLNALSDNGVVYIRSTLSFDKITEVSPFISWYIRCAVYELSKRYICPHIQYPPEMTTDEVLEDINNRLRDKENLMVESGYWKLYVHLLNYMGIFDMKEFK